MRHSLSQVGALIGHYFSAIRMHCNCAAGLAMNNFGSIPLVSSACSDFVTSHAATKMAYGIEDWLRAEQELVKRPA